ncbi:isoaspartyl peptidase/L-asparaginase family protein [Leeuwenhoekiella marinoflava]|uniref:Isoaspartyl peptidase n=2 Tax=Leeuwenhoekiella marinoflava TaxID=988 RepID=A0A4Q0PSX2_9FLAO|nr:isoaspartyl peptidase/L-asparaginase [Leeuwenhoekiella marinoflava]RXG33085.1 beta-aspartyl-peptidase (threonine type) [Leeuwenhoekiella marinoflava]SHE37943.1 beta-aspartyl-peptidase (threonine type) [Leeuwenhoekiella marinoflava DSM 3653]
MKTFYSLLLFGFLIISCKQNATHTTKTPQDTPKQQKFAIIIHGGAGTILKENMTDSLEKAYKAKLTEAIQTGHKILENGGTSLEAVQRTINVMENSPLFNSAKGAVFTHDGKNELDASIMDGKTLNAGAIAGVTNVKNPINLAYEVMTNSEHVLLSGKGAEAFAKEKGIEQVDPSYFFTEKRYNSLQRILEREKQDSISKAAAFYDPFIKDEKFGTVGCVALDKNGNLAAGTSTGGMTNKRYNRIGDSPIIGSGTYANNTTCGVSSTGWGEYFIRGQVAYDISAQMEYAKKTLTDATRNVIQEKLTKLGGTGGIVALDHYGNPSMEFNTKGMYRAYMNDQGELTLGIYEENEN